MLKVPKALKNEQGNVSLIVLLIIFGVILGIVVLSYYYGVFIVRRQAQNVVDAAAMAAVQELSQQYENQMKIEVEEQIEILEGSIIDEINDCIIGGALSCPTREDLLKERLGSSNELTQKLINETFTSDDDWDLVVLHSYFASYFTPLKNGDILYQVGVSNSTQIRHAANSVITKNQGQPSDFTLVFPYDGEPDIFVSGSKVLISQEVIEGSLDVPARGVAGLVTEFVINVSSKVPVTIE